VRYRHFRKPCVVSHERVLLKVAQSEPSARTSFWVARELRRVIDEEWLMRGRLWAAGLTHARRMEGGEGDGEGEDAECAICHLYLHLSAGTWVWWGGVGEGRGTVCL
jgi:hypothetical protein